MKRSFCETAGGAGSPGFRTSEKVISMKTIMQTTVTGIEDEEGQNPHVVLQCRDGETIPEKATVTTRSIFCEQQPVVVSTDRVKVLGKGQPSVRLGELVEITVVSRSAT